MLWYARPEPEGPGHGPVFHVKQAGNPDRSSSCRDAVGTRLDVNRALYWGEHPSGRTRRTSPGGLGRACLQPTQKRPLLRALGRGVPRET